LIDNRRQDPKRKIRVVIISGTLETGLHPVPPVADGAPEWNIFRLAEAAASNSDSILDIHIISPCETAQVEALSKYPVIDRDKYHLVVFNQNQLVFYRKILRHIFPIRLFVRRFAKLPDLMSWWYLRNVKNILATLSADIVIINARPQYIRYLRPWVNVGKLWFFMRGEMGESSRYLGLVDGIVVNSKGMQEYVSQFIKPGNPSIWQMPNSLDETFSSKIFPKDRFNRSKQIILFTGRLVPVKGVLELLNAFERVIYRRPETCLTICGTAHNIQEKDIPTDYEKKLKGRAQTLPNGSVVFTGFIPNSDLHKYYANADLAVFPSLGKESFGMVALEAMRCKTPVVASHCPGFEEQIVEGQTGYLVDHPENPEELANAILKILQDPQLARDMGEAGYLRSLKYSPIEAIRKLEEILITHGKSIKNS
jgi:glycosyltransferase involved in cell wall biosynthesis